MTDELRAALDAALPLLRLSPYEGAIEAADRLEAAVLALPPLDPVAPDDTGEDR